MKHSDFITTARNLRNYLVFNVNALRGREYIPAHRDTLCVETSSVCNLNCRFCAYSKKQSPKVQMANELFFDCVEQAVAMGYRKFSLTPMTGDVFMDKRLFEKLEFLDAHPDVDGYEFFTNFTLPDAPRIDRLMALKKLRRLEISIYGHDERSFIAITDSEAKLYQRLLENLAYLLQVADRRSFELRLGLRSERRIPPADSSRLLRMLERYKAAGIRVRKSRIYNNWGGYVSSADVAGLDIDITSADGLFKKGPCTLLFTDVQVLATGLVNACACRDVDMTLCIGDLKQQPLKQIISARNPVYMELIREQQRDSFRPVCRSCDFYKSIYRNRSSNRKEGLQTLSLSEFLQSIG